MRNNSVFIALFAALISVTCFIAIPAGPLGVPIVIQNMMAILCGAILGPVRGGAAVLIFLIAGALGLPVFSGGTGGFARFFGPTGGFLVGYFLGAAVTGLMLGNPKLGEPKTGKRRVMHILRVTAGIILGNVVIYAAGLARLTQILARTNIDNNIPPSYFDMLPAAFAAGVLPFIPGCIVKIIIAVPLTLALRPVAARYLNSER